MSKGTVQNFFKQMVQKVFCVQLMPDQNNDLKMVGHYKKKHSHFGNKLNVTVIFSQNTVILMFT